MKNVHLDKMKCRQWLFITVRLKTMGKRIFFYKQHWFQIDWILTVFDVHLHQQKTVATKQIFKNNFFLQKLDLVLMNRMMIVMWSVCSRDAFETFEMLGKRKCEQNGNVSRNDNYIQYNCFLSVSYLCIDYGLYFLNKKHGINLIKMPYKLFSFLKCSFFTWFNMHFER